MQAKVQEGLLQFQHPSYTEEGSHVTLQNLVHDVLAQKLLSHRDAFNQCALGEAAAKQVLVEEGRQRSGIFAYADKPAWVFPEEVNEGGDRRELGDRIVTNLEVFIKGKGCEPYGMPTPNARLQPFGLQGGRRARDGYPTPLLEIDLMLQPDLPILCGLDLVQENVLNYDPTKATYVPIGCLRKERLPP